MRATPRAGRSARAEHRDESEWMHGCAARKRQKRDGTEMQARDKFDACAALVCAAREGMGVACGTGCGMGVDPRGICWW